jgi:hypothetical protein
MKNYISKTPVFVFLLIIILFLMGLLPSFTFFDNEVQTVDLLSDIRKDLEREYNEIILPALPQAPPKKIAKHVSNVPLNVTCIVDYADSTQRGMQSYYKRLNQLDELDRPLHIAFLGDSFIEGDILSGDLRSLLQSEYGGCGVGLVGITSPTYGFRKTVRHRFKGWKSHFFTDTLDFSYRKASLGCAYFYAKGKSYVKLQGESSYGEHLDSCQKSSLFYLAPKSSIVYSRINKGKIQKHQLLPESKIKKLTIEGNIKQVLWQVNDSSFVRYYGVAMDGEKGIALDNYALRGSAGYNFAYIPINMLCQMNQVRPYDLIIVAYGLNVATANRTNYAGYQKRMVRILEHLKKGFPTAGFLLLSVGDRDHKDKKGNMTTMRGVKSLIRYQQLIAAESKIAFWNMHQAMGGDGSMAKLVKAKPSMANYDYTHINHRGGAFIARLLFDAMAYGKKQYDREYKNKSAFYVVK